MRKFVSILILLHSGLTIVHSQSQSYFWGNDIIKLTPDTSNYQTTIYGTQNGLAASEITCLAQDSKGYIWVGTSAGLSRFDGLHFENFFKADNSFTGKIYAIKEDASRNIVWIACDAGLCFFRDRQLHFAPFTETGVTVYDIYFPEKKSKLKQDEGMWIGTGKGPVFFPNNKIDRLLAGTIVSLSSFLLPQWKKLNNIYPAVYKIISSRRGNVYFAGAGNIFFYDIKTLKKIWAFDHQQDNNDNIVGMISGEDDVIYFASVFNGLYIIKNEEVTKLENDDYVSVTLIEHGGQAFYFTMGGIYEFLPATNRLKKISEVSENLNVWPSCLLVDNEDNFWIGMHDNLLYQKPRIFSLYNSPHGVSPELYSVLQRRSGQLLFGANRGKVYKKEGSVFKNIFGTGRAVPRAEIESMYEDSRGWLWLGSGYEGIAVINNNKIRQITKKDGLGNNSNYFFYEDAGGVIYTGGDGAFSKIVFDSLANAFHFKNFYYRVAGENLETFKSCIAGPGSMLWLAGQQGVFYLKNDSLVHYSFSNKVNVNVTAIKADKAGNVWLATKGDGILQCYFDAHALLQVKKIFTEEDGLQSNTYLSITTDLDNNIWAANYAGVTSIKKAGNKFTIANYTANEGFLSSNYQSLEIYCDNDDTLWVPASSGLVSFYAGNTNISKKLLLSFSNISTFDTSKKISSYKKNEDSIIELPNTVNGIVFEFKAICLSDPQRIVYSYRLLGIGDTAWLEWNNKQLAVYQNLPPGNYSFQVKASLDNNTITKPLTFSFIIKKPFWFAWWFIFSTVLIGTFIIYLLYKNLKRNIQRKHDEKIRTQKLISENLQYQLEVEQVTNYFSTSISNSETVDELLWDVAKQCISKLNFEDCVIYIKDSKTNMLLQKAAWGPKSGEEEQIFSPLSIPVGSGIVGAVAASGIAEIVPDVTKDKRYIKDDEQRLSEIAVPVIYNNNVLGVIDSESTQRSFYSQRHLQILTSIASHCAERIVKLRAEEELHQSELQLLQMQNRLAEEKLTALRSQMNPHFIFNCLNSIQQFILTGEVDNANKYLSQFSKLIRLVLQHSDNNFINLDEEISMLELYLSLEKTRFGNSFEYKISVEDELDTDEIKIPNLMIQPFVENAIWHGLMHKEGERKINISFWLRDNESIFCEIIDNGIGRKKAAEIKKQKSLEIKHESKGMKLIADKIGILKQQFQSEVLIEITDLLDSAGEICGTKVRVELPLQFE